MRQVEWTKRDDANLVAMREQGMTVAEIARILGKSRTAVYERVKVKQVPCNRRKIKIKQLARLTVPYLGGSTGMRSANVKWTDADDARLKFMLERRISVGEIAKELRVGIQSVRKRMKALGLRTGRRG